MTLTLSDRRPVALVRQGTVPTGIVKETSACALRCVAQLLHFHMRTIEHGHARAARSMENRIHGFFFHSCFSSMKSRLSIREPRPFWRVSPAEVSVRLSPAGPSLVSPNPLHHSTRLDTRHRQLTFYTASLYHYCHVHLLLNPFAL